MPAASSASVVVPAPEKCSYLSETKTAGITFEAESFIVSNGADRIELATSGVTGRYRRIRLFFKVA
jgi:hypothetical protein